MSATAVVVATRNRRQSLLATLDRLVALPERPEIVVVDNASEDGTAGAVARVHPSVVVIELERNVGAAARNVGAARTRAPWIAFADDDSWWAPGALQRAARHFEHHPSLGLVAARVLVGPEQRLDPTAAEMATSPLTATEPLPGPPVLGFIACGAVVRRSAFLAVGGFEERFGVGGEERLLALDLAMAGWRSSYAQDVVAHHHPAEDVRADRRGVVGRNDLWCAWLRYRPRLAVEHTARAALRGLVDRDARRAFGAALRGFGWALRHRAPVCPRIDAELRVLQRAARGSAEVRQPVAAEAETATEAVSKG